MPRPPRTHPQCNVGAVTHKPSLEGGCVSRRRRTRDGYPVYRSRNRALSGRPRFRRGAEAGWRKGQELA
eukprot:5637790-Pleurochrysis_carterae.AAC.1